MEPPNFDRRRFLGTVGAGALLPLAAACSTSALATPAAGAPAAGGSSVTPVQQPQIRPRRLRPGQTVGIVAPGSPVVGSDDIAMAREIVEAMGLRAVVAPGVGQRHGFLAGTDRQRADDLNAMFANPAIDAIFAIRGGWGSARILPLIDFDAIRRNPKVFVGYSDITALHTAIEARTGLVTFHGPMGVSTWAEFPLEHFRRVLFDAEALTLANPVRVDNLIQTQHRVVTITPGTARGRLAGGNLTVLSAIIGSPYLPDWTGRILFLEDIDENLHRIDRMLTQLALAGVLQRIAAFVFGKCTDCAPFPGPGGGYGALSFEQIFSDHIAPLGVPAWSGAMIGHITDQWTVPVGLEAEVDAAAGTIRLLQPAVL
jgi:muramoyltetrapeptide carboxypeptidase